MGVLVGMALPTPVFANLADHTYVKCDTGGAAWGCWGRKRGGRALRRGAGSTKRADRIAQPNERANITCYLINGVCHQAANRVLLPARITVRGARGYGVSQALYGTYGRLGLWPCRAPFEQYPRVTGDLPECVGKKRARAAGAPPPSADDKLDWQYLKGELELYRQGTELLQARSVHAREARRFHLRLFMHMAEFNLGPMLDRQLSRKLRELRLGVERARVKVEAALASRELEAREFVDSIDGLTLAFQDEMANAMGPAEFEALFEMKPDDRVVLADPRIVKRAYASRTSRGADGGE